jgi:hypothetical protein
LGQYAALFDLVADIALPILLLASIPAFFTRSPR